MVRRNKNNLKLVIIDRDGTLNVYREGYIKEPEEWVPVPGALEAISLLNRSGWHVVVASNQPAIGRGVMDAATLHAIHAVMHKQLAAVGGRIDAVFFCPHTPDEACHCRKPEPGLILRAAADMNIDLARSWMIGDRVRDVQAGLAAGCSNVLLRPPVGAYESDVPVPEGVTVVPHLPAAGVHILAPEMRAHRLTKLPGGSCGGACPGRTAL